MQVTMKDIADPTSCQVKALESMLLSVVKKYALNPDVDLPLRTQIAQELTAIIQIIIPGTKHVMQTILLLFDMPIEYHALFYQLF